MEVKFFCGWQKLKGERYPILYNFCNDFDGMPVEMYYGGDLEKTGLTPFVAYGGSFCEGTLKRITKDRRKILAFLSKDGEHDYYGDATKKLFRLGKNYEFIFRRLRMVGVGHVLFIVLAIRMHCGLRVEHIRPWGPEEERIDTGTIEHDQKDYYFRADDGEHDFKGNLSLETFKIPLNIEDEKLLEFKKKKEEDFEHYDTKEFCCQCSKVARDRRKYGFYW